MSKQLGFLTEKSDPILLDFLRDRKRFIAIITVLLGIAAIMMLYADGFEAWVIAVIITLDVERLWHEYHELSKRVRNGGFGDNDHPSDYELLGPYLSARGRRTEITDIG
jgi:hypothetical protein